MIVARFAGPDELVAAVAVFRRAGVAADTRTPVALPDDAQGRSRIPLVVLGAGLAAAIAAFLMQWYAAAVGYRLLIGGRPDFFWTSYLVYAVECGMLAATLTAFTGFFAANRLPALYDPSDECDALRGASRDGWFLVSDRDAQARRLLGGLRPVSLEHVA